MVSEQPERFFVSEIIREQIFLQYNKEIPYACQVGGPIGLGEQNNRTQQIFAFTQTESLNLDNFQSAAQHNVVACHACVVASLAGPA